jgi:urease accessory protein
VRSFARLRAERAADGSTRLVELCSEAPLAMRQTAEGLWLVGSAQGLVGTDELHLELSIGRGASLSIRSAAATIAYTSSAAQYRVHAHIESEGRLDWHPEPLIATANCHLSASVEIELEAGAAVDWTEECLLGRSNEEPGTLELSVSVDRESEPALRHQIAIGTAVPGWDGPAVLGRARSVGQRVLLDPLLAVDDHPGARSGEGWALLPLEGGGFLVSAYALDLLGLRAAMEVAHGALFG